MIYIIVDCVNLKQKYLNVKKNIVNVSILIFFFISSSFPIHSTMTTVSTAIVERHMNGNFRLFSAYFATYIV